MKTAKNILIALLLAMTALFTACGNDTADGIEIPDGMILACDPAVTDYLMFVPEEWTVDMTTAASGAYFSGKDASGVSMMVFEMPNADSTLDDWWTTHETDLSSVFKNYALESSDNTTISGIHARKHIYTGEIGAYSYKVMQIAALKHGNVYMFTYTSLADLFDSHLDDVAKITDSLIIE